MRYTVECYENQSLFKGEPGSPILFTNEQHAAWAAVQPNLLVALLSVDADTPESAADKAFEIANAPWNPTDSVGFAWPHDRIRSMSSGDSVLVRNSATFEAFVCGSWGWLPVRRYDLNIVKVSLK
jgi:hypothetical protein